MLVNDFIFFIVSLISFIQFTWAILQNKVHFCIQISARIETSIKVTGFGNTGFAIRQLTALS